MRLIDADNLKKDLNVEFIFDSRDRCRVRNLIDFQLTIDAEPVRRGRWLINKEDGWITIAPCSVCGGVEDVDFPYCPNCGAKMEEQE